MGVELLVQLEFVGHCRCRGCVVGPERFPVRDCLDSGLGHLRRHLRLGEGVPVGL